MDNKDTGLLLNRNNIILHRKYFKQMLQLHGIRVKYQAPINDTKGYDLHAELDTRYYDPIDIFCLYLDHPDQKTRKKMGWNAELGDDSIMIVVEYDVPNIQEGALITLPSAIDNSKGRIFKILNMKIIPIYPCSITCELGPVLEDSLTPAQVIDFSKSNFNLLYSEEDEE